MTPTNTEALAAELDELAKVLRRSGNTRFTDAVPVAGAAAELRRLSAVEAERDALQVGIELMQDNAARYCWLRDNEDGDYGICVWDSDDGWARDARSPAVVDAALDVAMKGTP